MADFFRIFASELKYLHSPLRWRLRFLDRSCAKAAQSARQHGRGEVLPDAGIALRLQSSLDVIDIGAIAGFGKLIRTFHGVGAIHGSILSSSAGKSERIAVKQHPSWSKADEKKGLKQDIRGANSLTGPAC